MPSEVMSDNPGAGRVNQPWLLAGAMLLMAAGLPLDAQTQPAASGTPASFEVATIKQNDPARNPGVLSGVSHPSPVRHHYVGSLRFLIRQAYTVDDDQISGGPAWMDRDVFEIDAKAAAPAKDEALNQMLAGLLAERFQLKYHQESKQKPIYTLLPAKGGAKLQAAEGKGVGVGRGNVRGTMDMATLARTLTPVLRRMVVDQTGLPGTYKVSLQWTPDDAADTGGPSLFTAIQEQLGLRLEAGKGAVPVLVIDRAERPSEN